MKFAPLILPLLLCSCEKRQAATQAAKAPAATTVQKQKSSPPPKVSTVSTTSAQATWQDRLNGRKYPLPDSIGGKPAAFYLNSSKVSPLAKALYTARFRPTDDDSTAQLLALVTTDDAEIRPFYRWCLDFTINISDGALGEYPGEPALAYATKFPREFFAYMDKDSTGERYQKWVDIIGYSGLLNYHEAPAAIEPKIRRQMSRACADCHASTSKRIAGFAHDVTYVYQKIMEQ